MFGLVSGLVGAGLSFIGGKKNRKSQERIHAREQYLNSPQGIRDEAEKAGFNPLTVMNSGRQFGAGYAPQFGNEYAALGQGLADAVTGYEQLQIQRAELDLETQRLKELQKATAMGPKIAGIYGDRSNAGTGPKRSRATGGTDSDADNLDSAAALRAARLGGAADASDYIDAEAPALKVFNTPFYGSGAISSGQGVEDALGESPLSWVAAPFIAADMIGHTIGNAVSARGQRKADAAMDEWARRVRENDPIKPKKKKKSEAQRRREEKAMRDADRRLYPNAY